MGYTGLDNVSSAGEQHLGGNIREGDPYTHAPRVWDYILDRFAVKTVLDLGCGMGYSSQYFFNRGRQVIAVDGLKENIDKAVYPSVAIDLEKGPVYCRVDLVHCQEVVEHIEETFIENLLQSLACGRFVLMTHAVPGQGGYHHVNLKPAEYWIEHMARYHCSLMEEDTRRVRALATEDGAAYLARTGMLFANKAR